MAQHKRATYRVLARCRILAINIKILKRGPESCLQRVDAWCTCLAGGRSISLSVNCARGVPVAIGVRAFEIMEVLVQSAGQLVTKDDLMGRVWRGAIVEE